MLHHNLESRRFIAVGSERISSTGGLIHRIVRLSNLSTFVTLYPPTPIRNSSVISSKIHFRLSDPHNSSSHSLSLTVSGTSPGLGIKILFRNKITIHHQDDSEILDHIKYLHANRRLSGGILLNALSRRHRHARHPSHIHEQEAGDVYSFIHSRSSSSRGIHYRPGKERL